MIASPDSSQHSNLAVSNLLNALGMERWQGCSKHSPNQPTMIDIRPIPLFDLLASSQPSKQAVPKQTGIHGMRGGESGLRGADMQADFHMPTNPSHRGRSREGTRARTRAGDSTSHFTAEFLVLPRVRQHHPRLFACPPPPPCRYPLIWRYCSFL